MSHHITLVVNGHHYAHEVEPRMLLSDVLRHELGLTGTHVGCEQGFCGACTVLLAGQPVRSCLLFAVQADGLAIETVEGLASPHEGGPLHPLQEAMARHHALQCGFCTPGVLMTLLALLREQPEPSADEVRLALSGHLCRCTGYAPIVAAALDVRPAVDEATR